MPFLWRIADNRRSDSLASRFRRRRFTLFLELLEGGQGTVTILDVGGTAAFWNEMLPGAPVGKCEVTLLNVNPSVGDEGSFHMIQGDARDLRQFPDKHFDVVFSNSVIEHVGGWEDQKRMASEVRRVGHRYFVQTPNYFFPIEPHFLVPGFQWLPFRLRVWLVRKRSLGWMGRREDVREAEALVSSVRLLRESEIRQLFPGGTIYKERALGLVKSFVAYGGSWEAEGALAGS